MGRASLVRLSLLWAAAAPVVSWTPAGAAAMMLVQDLAPPAPIVGAGTPGRRNGDNVHALKVPIL
jgi:hypothetical protein